MKTNYHTHTKHCRHAGGLPVDYAEKGIDLGIEILGISDHAPFEPIDFGCRMPFSELDEYCDEIDEARIRFQDKIKILKAVEIEWLPEFESNFHGKNYYEWLLTEKKMDYLLLGEHFFKDKKGNQHNITAISETSLAVEYAEACVKAMETGYFKILAHPDLYCINSGFAWNDDYEKAADILIEGSAKTGVILEFNANGFRRGIKAFPDGERFQYPHRRFWEKVASAGLSAVIGSDAHDIKLLWDEYMEKSIQCLHELGIKRLTSL